MKNELTFVPVNEIEATSKTQVRVRLDSRAIDEYANDMKNGDVFPPLTVFAEKGSSRFILADGFHRLAAMKKAGITDANCEIQEGNLHDARRFALGINHNHGVRRTIEDKKKAVSMAMEDEFFDGKPLRFIADHCKVSHEYVRREKQEANEEKADTERDKREAKEPKEQADTSVTGNTRTPPKAPTQPEIDRRDLLGAVDTVRNFPYDGAEAPAKMELTPDDLEKIDYVAGWMGALCYTMEEPGK